MLTPEEERWVYDQHCNSLDDPAYVAYFKRFIDSAVIDFAGKGRNGLDFGSGPSPVLSAILERDYGFSMDSYDLFYAPDKIYQNKKYDLITSTEMVEHLQDPLRYFKRFKSLLDENGLLAVMTLFHPDEDLDFLNSHYVRDKTHISFFSLKTMVRISELIGLDIVYTDQKRYISFRTK
jgi:hypothetical protein